MAEEDLTISAVFRSTFPSVEDTGFRTGAWRLGVARTAEELEPLHPTMLHALSAAAKLSGTSGLTILPDDEEAPEVELSYRRLFADARRVAAALAQKGLRKGDRVLMVLPTSAEFVIAFFGIELAGAIPVPSYPPAALEKTELAIGRLKHVASHAGVRMCLSSRALLPLLGELAFSVDSMRHLLAIENLLESEAPPVKAKVEAKDPAFIQYTSGSTGQPKGVLLSHRNVTSNVHAIGQAVKIGRRDVSASWLPLYHDMGLIGVLLFSVYWRIPCVLLSPLAFLMRPSRWLWAIHRFRATLSPAPNFGYGLCVKRVRPSEREGLDLSSWRLALNGAEPVNLRTVRDFTAAFEPHGFRKESMYPVYGLAESSLAVTFPELGGDVRHEVVDRSQLAAGRVVAGKGVGSMAVVSVGRPVPGHEVLIVDAEGRRLEERAVGHIIVKGPSVMQGYFRFEEATERVIRAGWLWTGDLGFFSGGELFVTGRAKDLIIVRGKNFYAEDIERIAERVEGVRQGGAAAFGLYDEERAADLAVCVCETRVSGQPERKALAERVSESVSTHCGLALDEVVLVPPGTLPKTSSGKRQRALCRELYLKDALVPARTGKLRLAWVFARSGAGFFSLLKKRLGSRREPD